MQASKVIILVGIVTPANSLSHNIPQLYHEFPVNCGNLCLPSTVSTVHDALALSNANITGCIHSKRISSEKSKALAAVSSVCCSSYPYDRSQSSVTTVKIQEGQYGPVDTLYLV
ncbi:hypothetical protein BC830DRAFT_1154762 [Chytriomyces sp. MP71]|nr:hypothetical protein BC830DRAFT_1154762 [Chytriomyces sp. MP71]